MNHLRISIRSGRCKITFIICGPQHHVLIVQHKFRSRLLQDEQIMVNASTDGANSLFRFPDLIRLYQINYFYIYGQKRAAYKYNSGNQRKYPVFF